MELEFLFLIAPFPDQCLLVPFYRGIPIFLIFDPKHRLWVLVTDMTEKNVDLDFKAHNQ